MLFKIFQVSFLFVFIGLFHTLAFAAEPAKPIQPKEPVAPSAVVAPPDFKLPDVSAYDKLLNNRYSLFTHERTYILPFSYNATPHNEIYSGLLGLEEQQKGVPFYGNTEAEFQISFFIPIYRHIADSKWDLLVAYTHHAWWQVYNSSWSRPFRETNYKPEIFFRKVNHEPTTISIFNVVAYDVGYVHQSNGQIQVVSRSWDRVFGRTYLVSPSFSLSLEAWIRLPEKDDDDNTDILTYMGLGEATLHKSFGNHTIEAKVPFAAKPGLEFQYSYPWHDHLRWFVSASTGFGHSLIEYNKESQRIGVGITVETFMDKQNTDTL